MSLKDFAEYALSIAEEELKRIPFHECGVKFVAPDIPTTDEYSVVDWSSEGNPLKRHLVTRKIADQKSCRSCYAHAASGLYESHLCRSQSFDCRTWTGIDTQELVTCSQNMGCSGGSVQNCLDYVKDFGLREVFNGTCGKKMNSPTTASVMVAPRIRCGKVGKTDLSQALYKFGPVTSGLDALDRGFQFYSAGVYQRVPPDDSANHAILVVGHNYQTSSFKIKNSWGRSWGQNGYAEISSDFSSNANFGADNVYLLPEGPDDSWF